MSEERKDVCDYLGEGGSMDAALAAAIPMVPVEERHAEDIERGRAALKAAMLVLGAEQTTTDERNAAARRLTEAVPDLAWLSVLHPAEWAQTCAALQSAGGFATRTHAIQRAVNEAAKAVRAEIADQRRRERAVVPAAGEGIEGVPLPDELAGLVRIPVPYLVTPGGIFLRRPGKGGDVETVRVAARPLLISAIGTDLEEETQSVTVQWWYDASWRERTVPRKVIQVARLLAEESDHGLPVSSASASAIVEFFEAYLRENEERLPKVTTTRSLGWKKGHGFLWGTTLIGPDGEKSDAAIRLSLLDAGPRQAAQSYRASGTFEGWCAAIREVAHLERIMLAIYAGMIPPLLAFLPTVANPIVDWCGEPGTGKTTALRAAASVWGVPDERKDGIVKPWDAKSTFIERFAAFANDLPLLLDDTTRCEDPTFISQVVYMVSQGQGKGRGNLKSFEVTSTWRTALLSTGETSATSYGNKGGAAARCLTVWGAPADSGDRSVQLVNALMQHHGHVGPRLVAWLQQPGRAAWVRERYEHHVAALRPANAGGALHRLAAPAALVRLAQEIAGRIGVPDAARDVLAPVAEAAHTAAEEGDKAKAALGFVYAWAVSEQLSFWGRHAIQIVHDVDGNPRTEPRTPPRGRWIGMWGMRQWDEVAFIKDVLRDQLMRAKYDADAVFRAWKKRGWLVYTGTGTSRSTRVAGAAVHCIVVRRAALEEAGFATADV